MINVRPFLTVRSSQNRMRLKESDNLTKLDNNLRLKRRR